MPSVNDSRNHGTQSGGQAYWRSLDHLSETEEFREFMHREFPAGATDLLDSGERRHFLKIMGASMALAGLGLAGCRRWPDEHIAPYARRPAGRDPGVPVFYGTCMDIAGVATGLLAKSYDGRPVKIEGNPDHPTSLGAADVFAQASVLDLYDPDRSRGVRHDDKDSTWDAFEKWANGHFGALRSQGGAGLAVLSEASSSPSVTALRMRFEQAFPNATWHEYEPVNNDNEIVGAELAFGRAVRAQYDFEKAAAIVCLDADLFSAHPNRVANMRGFARGRRLAGEAASAKMSRLYAFEADLSLTGANADERIAMSCSDVTLVAARLAARLIANAPIGALAEDGALDAATAARVDALADHLRAIHDDPAMRGRSIIVAGSRQPAEVHLLVHLLNDTLGNVGTTVNYSATSAVRHVGSLGSLVATKPQTLVILGGNPVYNAPADMNFAAWLKSVGTTVHLGDYRDETGSLCKWHVNRAHYLEAWGDGRAWDGTYSIAQPLIMPLFDGRSAIELLAVLTGDDLRAGEAIVKRTFRQDIAASASDDVWRTALHDGIYPGSAAKVERPRATTERVGMAMELLAERRAARGSGNWEVVFAEHPTLHDGRFANNGWLQETPDPMTKLTWDNAVLMSPAAAEALGLGTDPKSIKGRLVTVNVGGTSVEGPVMLLPGVADHSVIIHLGGGRRFPGRICEDAGFDVYPIRTSGSMGYAGGASIQVTGGQYVLACTQDHHTIDVNSVGGRGVQTRLSSLFREATIDEYRANPNFAHDPHHTGAEVVHRLSMWSTESLSGEYKWGMSIDLNACTGCGACIVACQAENNIPIVGKDQVNRGREMHWMRIDRYFKFAVSATDEHGKPTAWDPNSVTDVALQPVLCMMCENAPCEQVCPVAATVHDEDGLNVMVYNRCVGTRYCSNNCPYKVRRFNYFDYHRRGPLREQPGTLLQVEPEYYTKRSATPDELKQLQFNPEVTVRMRGVMEKCTYCIQRISEVRIAVENAFAGESESQKQAQAQKRIAIPDGMITPACAQTCPAEAIVFGDLNDPKSRVGTKQREKRAYEMLEELNVRARTKYLAKVRNPVSGGAAATGGGGHNEEHADNASHS